MRKFEQTAELIRQQISVIRSEAEQKIRVTNATGYADAYKIKQFATAKANNNTINTESEIYKLSKDKMSLDGNQLNQYIFLNALHDQRNAKLLVGLQNSIINFGNSNSPTERSR